MIMSDNREQVSVQELLITVNATQDAIVELLEEKGLITKVEIIQKIKELQAEIQAKKN